MAFDRQIRREIEESRAIKAALADQCVDVIAQIARVFVDCLKAGNKVLLFGNGGSAADAQHIAGELVGRYLAERPGLPAIALSDNPSILTAVGNDLGYDHVFARQIEALGKAGDVAVAISTTGNSPNVLRGISTASAQGMRTIGLSGKTGGKMRGMVEICLCVPSDAAPRIQEAHMLVGHIISGIVERAFLPEGAATSAK